MIGNSGVCLRRGSNGIEGGSPYGGSRAVLPRPDLGAERQ
jgi:hypothetical protein